MSQTWLVLVAAALSTGAAAVRDDVGVASDAVDVASDRAAIRRAALDYAEGYYEGSAERMARAVHPALLKRGLLPSGSDDRFLQLMSAETLIDLTDGQRGAPPVDHRLDFALLDLRGDVASARIFTDRFNDYLQLARQRGRWRVVNVLWQVPASAGSEQDKAAVRSALGEYYEALFACDAARIRRVVHPELVRRTLRPGAQGALVLDDASLDQLLGAPQLVPAVQGHRVQLVDVHDRIASAVVVQGEQGAYVHLAKQNGDWRLVNLLSAAQRGR